MKVRDLMTRDVRVASPDETLQHAATIMVALDAGILPVAENGRLVGMITDRDIAVNGVAIGKGPDATVGEVMTRDVKYCYDDQEINEITDNMAEIQVRRLPVLSRDKRLVGIVSLGDIAQLHSGASAGEALVGITEPTGQHNQT